MTTRYYVPELIPHPLQRLKARWLDRRRPVPAAPNAVQIQTVSGCNANCVFCPNTKTALEIPLGRRMDWDLYRSLVDQCVTLGVRRFSPYLMNESMLDPELPARVEYITRKKKKNQYTKINSHGALLSENMARGLLEAGLDRLNFSVQGIDPEGYESIMGGLKFEKVVANIERFQKLAQAGHHKIRLRVVMLDTVEIHDDLPRIYRFWKARGIQVNVNQLENRGQHSNIQSDDIAVRELQNYDWCTRMFEQAYVLYDGRLVMCCADWEQTSDMGDLRNTSLAELWRGKTFAAYRRKFLAGEVEGMLCDGCTKDAAGPSDEDDN